MGDTDARSQTVWRGKVCTAWHMLLSLSLVLTGNAGFATPPAASSLNAAAPAFTFCLKVSRRAEGDGRVPIS